MNILNIFKKASNEGLAKQNELAAKKLFDILEQKVPAESLPYCMKLWHEHPFSFTLSKTRNSCFGNYTLKDGQHKITINHDLSESAFLITYIHEVAHQRAWLLKGRKKIEPHGKEWKQNFQKLMQPMLKESVFPIAVLKPLQLYMENPAASSMSFAPLAHALRSVDGKEVDDEILLAEVAENASFVFREKVFMKLEKRRTRVLCLEQKSKKRYTILASARVKLMTTDLS